MLDFEEQFGMDYEETRSLLDAHYNQMTREQQIITRGLMTQLYDLFHSKAFVDEMQLASDIEYLQQQLDLPFYDNCVVEDLVADLRKDFSENPQLSDLPY